MRQQMAPSQNEHVVEGIHQRCGQSPCFTSLSPTPSCNAFSSHGHLLYAIRSAIYFFILFIFFFISFSHFPRQSYELLYHLYIRATGKCHRVSMIRLGISLKG